MILKNITMDAADQIAVWARQFEAWASQLEPDEEVKALGMTKGKAERGPTAG